MISSMRHSFSRNLDVYLFQTGFRHFPIFIAQTIVLSHRIFINRHVNINISSMFRHMNKEANRSFRERSFENPINHIVQWEYTITTLTTTSRLVLYAYAEKYRILDYNAKSAASYDIASIMVLIATMFIYKLYSTLYLLSLIRLLTRQPSSHIDFVNCFTQKNMSDIELLSTFYQHSFKLISSCGDISHGQEWTFWCLWVWLRFDILVFYPAGENKNITFRWWTTTQIGPRDDKRYHTFY